MKLEELVKIKKLEVYCNKSWHVVNWNIFRSWSGSRRVDGKPYEGPVYYLGSDVEAPKPKRMN